MTNLSSAPSLQLPFANAGDQQRLPIRQHSASPAGMGMGPGRPLIIHDPRTKHYLDCYWQYFHPLFPIVQLQSFTTTIPDPLLAASMVVVGAQFSPRPDAKPYSASLHVKCSEMISDVSAAIWELITPEEFANRLASELR